MVSYNTMHYSRAYFALYPGGTSSLEQTTVPQAAHSSRTVYICYSYCMYQRTSELCTTSDLFSTAPKIPLVNRILAGQSCTSQDKELWYEQGFLYGEVKQIQLSS